MNYQKMRIDFTQKRGLTAPFVYKTGEIDVDGIEAELVNIDVEGSPIGFIKLISPTGIERESALRIENGFAYFDIPKNEEGLYTVELTILNKKNKTRSGNIAIEVINSLSYDSEEYETLLDTITQHDAEYTTNENIRIENENIRIENENTRIIEHGDRMSKSDVATANAIQATQQANTATANAETATQATIQATTEAGSATTNAIQATNNAQAATVEADSATAKANVAATNAANATTTANQATVNANKATADANSATQSVNNAIAAGTVDLETKQARTDATGFEHANLKTRLDEEFKELASKIPTDAAMNGYESVTTNDTLSGDVKNTTLTGQTLVNVGSYTNTKDNDGWVSVSGKTAIHSRNGSLAKPNTKYTMVVFVKEANQDFLQARHEICITNSVLSYLPGWSTTTLKNGTNVKVLTSIADFSVCTTKYFTHTEFSYDKPTGTAKVKYIILEGDHTDKPLEFFEGLKSAEVSEIESLNIDNTKSSKTTFAPITLRSLPNGVADTYDVDTGVLTRRCGEVVLDGSESWASLWQNDPLLDPSLIGFNCTGLQTSKVTHVANCDKFKTFPQGAMLNSKSECLGTYSNNTPIIIAKSKLTTPDVAGFKAWLAQNPTTVVYQLATPTTEYIENNGQLRSYDSQTTVFANSIVPVKIGGNIPVNYASTFAKTMQSLDELQAENRELKNTIEELYNDVNQIHAFMYAMMNNANTLEEE